jgi:hypothetical protein
MFNLFNIDGKALLPIALAVLAAFGVYWLYTKSQANQAATAEANANATALNAEGGGEDTADQQLATLEALFGGGSTTTDTTPTDQTVLSAPGTTVTGAGTTTTTTTPAAPTTSGSSTGDTTVNQV